MKLLCSLLVLGGITLVGCAPARETMTTTTATTTTRTSTNSNVKTGR